ncbi:SGNH/GDSL hydrolase family protein [Chitinophaga horti]|uniref:SGNH/GDSL hydrolase family protein n=1 Tax=Chitinophaga horti TaxID=2920382 RepID=A0ABY6J6E7_9BACT|nr:SGNH/GDSL hydrolase family protein [Chitinophaga horti]UYQ93866.1 SGNH/GDSL hydrolase family protein [Chitinophaga horti]
MKLILFLGLCALSVGSTALAQGTKTWNPAHDKESVVGGQAWHTGIASFYDRLPAKAEKAVRKPVWDLSHNGAGLHLRFVTDAPEITVRYQVTGNIQMPHMPATGVSGVDLYAKDGKGQWLWSAGKYSFKDTISYQFPKLQSATTGEREYTLYLPLYNSVKWLEVIYPDGSKFTALPPKTKPIVVYGTSIAQGACASRPGLAWTNILSRKLDRQVINLAFSGNGRLEKEIVELLPEIDASLYILDCMPNLTRVNEFPDADIKQRIKNAVTHLQAQKPGVPIILTEHDGYTDAGLNAERRQYFERVNKVLREAFAEMKAKGVYLLPISALGQDIETMVDGTHPNDIGMLRYAEAYEKLIKKIK